MGRAVTLSSIISALVAAIVTYFSLSSPVAPVEKEKRNQIDVPHIELDELIKLYMLPAEELFPGVLATVGSWSEGSEPGTPISWEHAGIKDCDDWRKKEFGIWACRTGSVV